MYWQCGRFKIDLAEPKVMGIVNMTPDSFSDGGVYSQNLMLALAHAQKLLDDGADILDIGGESSRPNAAYVSPEEELKRVLPLLKELYSWNVPVTLDTRRTAVMREALSLGVLDAINDIEALRDEGAVDLLAQSADIGICLMHMQGQPENMQHNPHYDDVLAEVTQFLRARVDDCLSAGIATDRIVLDPGIGFGKELKHNLSLLKDLPLWQAQLALPVLIGVSRKTMLGQITGEKIPKERLGASIAVALESVRLGANIIRVHDVKEVKQALQVYSVFQSW